MKRSPLKRKTALKPSKGPLERKPMQRGQPKRDWREAIAKRDTEGRCRVCGSTQDLEAAHTIGRSRQDPGYYKPGKEEPQFQVLRDSIVPLCREHHKAYDARSLDLLPYLTMTEQINAVEAAGGIEAARRRLTGMRS